MWKSGREIGHGGSCVVRSARREGDQAAYAIKKVSPQQARDELFVRRFRRELRIHQSLKHPNIVRIVDAGTNDARPWFVMLRADSNLAAALHDSDDLLDDRDLTLATFRQILEAVAYAHGRGVIHRDLKPRNVLMFGDVPRLTDFGLGKDLTRDSSLKTRTSAWAGTAPYAAPEQMQGRFREADERADIYALGKILQEMLTGRIPYQFDPKLPAEYSFIVRKATATAPAARFQSVEELMSALEEANGPTDRVLPFEDQVRALLTDAETTEGSEQREAILRLHILLEREADDEMLMRQVIPEMSRELLNAYAAGLPDEFDRLVEIYDEAVAGFLRFDYCDTAANFLVYAYLATDNLGVRERILSRLLEMGYSHNRGYVGKVSATVLCRMKEPGEIQMGVGVIRSLPAEASWIADHEVIREKGIARPLALALRDAA